MIVRLKSPTLHALRILKCMAQEEQKSTIGSEICQKVDVTHSYFMRIAKELRTAGILETIQGRNGGFVLSREADQITLYDVVQAMEGDGEPIHDQELSPLAEFVTEVNENIEQQMKHISIASL